jgi:tellurite resistance protein
MPRDLIEQARRDRNAALIDVMVLAASADGAVRETEMRALVTRVIERPEFDGTHAKDLGVLIEASAKRLSHARKLEDVLSSLRERLPDHRNRLLAFGLAASVVLADRKATKTELGLLTSVQTSLGISNEEVSRVFEVVETGESLAEALGEPLERMYVETMVLVSAADGVVDEKELRAMLENMAGDPVFRDVSLEAARHYLADAVQSLAVDGLPSRLAGLAHGLSTRAQRLNAFRLGVHIAFAAGEPSPAEQKVLDLLQFTLGLPDEDVARISSEGAR